MGMNVYDTNNTKGIQVSLSNVSNATEMVEQNDASVTEATSDSAKQKTLAFTVGAKTIRRCEIKTFSEKFKVNLKINVNFFNKLKAYLFRGSFNKDVRRQICKEIVNDANIRTWLAKELSEAEGADVKDKLSSLSNILGLEGVKKEDLENILKGDGLKFILQSRDKNENIVDVYKDFAIKIKNGVGKNADQANTALLSLKAALEYFPEAMSYPEAYDNVISLKTALKDTLSEGSDENRAKTLCEIINVRCDLLKVIGKDLPKSDSKGGYVELEKIVERARKKLGDEEFINKFGDAMKQGHLPIYDRNLLIKLREGASESDRAKYSRAYYLQRENDIKRQIMYITDDSNFTELFEHEDEIESIPAFALKGVSDNQEQKTLSEKKVKATEKMHKASYTRALTNYGVNDPKVRHFIWLLQNTELPEEIQEKINKIAKYNFTSMIKNVCKKIADALFGKDNLISKKIADKDIAHLNDLKNLLVIEAGRKYLSEILKEKAIDYDAEIVEGMLLFLGLGKESFITQVAEAAKAAEAVAKKVEAEEKAGNVQKLLNGSGIAFLSKAKDLEPDQFAKEFFVAVHNAKTPGELDSLKTALDLIKLDGERSAENVWYFELIRSMRANGAIFELNSEDGEIAKNVLGVTFMLLDDCKELDISGIDKVETLYNGALKKLGKEKFIEKYGPYIRNGYLKDYSYTLLPKDNDFLKNYLLSDVYATKLLSKEHLDEIKEYQGGLKALYKLQINKESPAGASSTAAVETQAAQVAPAAPIGMENVQQPRPAMPLPTPRPPIPLPESAQPKADNNTVETPREETMQKPAPAADRSSEIPAAPEAPAAPTAQTTPAGNRSELLEQIRGGVELRHVEPDKSVPKGNGSLLEQIRQGTVLKKVGTPKEKSVLTKESALTGVFGRISDKIRGSEESFGDRIQELQNINEFEIFKDVLDICKGIGRDDSDKTKVKNALSDSSLIKNLKEFNFKEMDYPDDGEKLLNAFNELGKLFGISELENLTKSLLNEVYGGPTLASVVQSDQKTEVNNDTDATPPPQPASAQVQGTGANDTSKENKVDSQPAPAEEQPKSDLQNILKEAMASRRSAIVDEDNDVWSE